MFRSVSSGFGLTHTWLIARSIKVLKLLFGPDLCCMVSLDGCLNLVQRFPPLSICDAYSLLLVVELGIYRGA